MSHVHSHSMNTVVSSAAASATAKNAATPPKQVNGRPVWGVTRGGDYITGEDMPFDESVHRYKVLMAPLNIAGQPMALINSLRDLDVYVRLFMFTENRFKFAPPDLMMNRNRDISRRENWQMMIDTAEHMLNQDFDIHHYWHKTLLFNNVFTNFTGLDLPFVKAAGKKLVHRFTGWDLRRVDMNLDWNPYSAFRYGYQLKSYTDDDGRRKWLDYLRQYTDALIVVDHEMHQYCPQAHIIPRSLRLDDWTYTPLEPSDTPRLIHFPTDPEFKGTYTFRKVVEELRDEGLKFQYDELMGLPNARIRNEIRDSDIILDQLHLGWYGVGAMEAMAIGRPVVVYINDELEQRFGDQVPVANANPDNVKDQLRKLIKDYEWRKEISESGRDFLVRHHDSHKVAAQTKAVYDTLIPADKPRPMFARPDSTPPVSLAWLERQMQWSYKHPWRRTLASSGKKIAVASGIARVVRKSPALTKSTLRLLDRWSS